MMRPDRVTLTRELAKQVTLLVDDLRTRDDTGVASVAEVVSSEWDIARTAERTALDRSVWREGLFAQVAVGWVLGTTFLRFCEDNGMLGTPVLSAPEAPDRRRVEDAQRYWFRDHPAEGERAYVEHVVGQAATLPGLEHVFEAHNPFWLFGPSDDAVRSLLAFWREVDPDSGELLRDLACEEQARLDTRFLGDLYQDLSEHAKKQFALLQTPEFVEGFILDRTVGPALDEFGLEGIRLIDPACGSGHFLLGAFDRLLARWQQRAPQEGSKALAERALASIYGVDINPFAAAIARFRLLAAALDATGHRRLDQAPNFTFNITVGDSLLHGPPPGQMALEVIDENADETSHHIYATEDRETINRYLSQKYHAVVANPPYITPKDPAANAAYRREHRYGRVCHRQYALAVPFMQRLFDLAVRGDRGQPAGFVGQITANSFMKREFGKKLIEGYLKRDVDLTHVLDTSLAHVPGHGTPTVILLGRNRKPVGDTMRAVLGIQGEPSRPAVPEKGKVWSSIVGLVDQPGTEDEFVSVADLPRERLAKHPWSLQGGGAVELKELMERGSVRTVASVCELIGYTGQTNVDAVMLAPAGALQRRGVEPHVVRRLVVGDLVRDWWISTGNSTVFPYGPEGLLDINELPALRRWLWPVQTVMGNRRTFAKRSYFEEKRPWWAWHQAALDRLKTPFSIIFAFVATHNHFVLDRDGRVSKQSALMIKLAEGASEDDHLELLGPLNSAVGCFWMKQVFHNKGVGGIGGGIGDEAWEPRYEFDGTKLKQFPLPEGSALAWAKRLDELAHELSDNHPTTVAAAGAPTRDLLEKARANTVDIRARMVAEQEELDWRCLHLYGLTHDDLSLHSGVAPPLQRGERAFEIVLARRAAAGQVQTTWFERHGVTPVTEVPQHWPEDYREMVEQRIALIEKDRMVALVERPEYKRRWNWDAWEELEAEALRTWLLDRLEEPALWPRPAPRSARALADDAARDPEFAEVAALYAGAETDLTELVAQLVTEESVPYLARLRHTRSGLRKRAQWERTWELQRREDAGEPFGIDGPVPVPPRYTKVDFVGQAWRHRGELDVPKERFIAYPGAAHDNDPTPLVGWAGWNHLEAAQALAELYEARRRQGWSDPDKLVPLLAGVAELVPWLRLWHNQLDPATGQRLGDFFDSYVTAEAANLGTSREALGHSPDD